MVGDQIRLQLGEAAKAAAKAVGYYNAGTVEFIFDTTNDQFYFMEMNTRLQVEHPVTEMITGQDLVEWQIRVAAGQKLPITNQIHIPFNGHAIEARVYAEDPDNGFLPQTGKITVLREPDSMDGTVRVDTGIREGDTITTFYDPMISKVIVHGKDRDHAISGLYRALQQYKVIGLPTNIKFLERVLKHPVFKSGVFDTSFIEQNQDQLLKPSKELSLYRRGSVAIVKVWLENLKYRTRRDSDLDPWAMRDMFRINHSPMRSVTIVKGDEDAGEEFHVQYDSEHRFNVYLKDDKGMFCPIILDAECDLSNTNPDQMIIRTDHHSYMVDYYMDTKEYNIVTQLDYEGAPLNYKVKATKPIMDDEEEAAASAADHVKSPMPGTVVKVACKAGDKVKAGTVLATLESMKMEYQIKATHDCEVSNVHIQAGQFVNQKQKLISFA